MNVVSGRPDFQAWREEARALLVKGVAPADTSWSESPSLFSETAWELKPLPEPRGPKEFFELAAVVACARDAERWSLLYRIIYRLNHENPNLLQVSVDPDVRRAEDLAKSVRRDIHKMHAFVRFKRVEVEGRETYVAWHRPEHMIIELAAPFFMRRFGDKPWSIFTPEASAHWNLETLSYGEGLSQNQFEHHDPFDEVWKTYYRSIFNPARLKIKAMKAEMSPKYWAALPESAVIRELIRDTPKRLQNMAEAPMYKAEVPQGADWHQLREAAAGCRACPIAAQAHHTVFGEGPLDASIMIVGEQPGDEEDLAGRAFIGPAGKVLDVAFAAANLKRDSVYITNAVKHFKWTPDRETKARKHQRASGTEMQACKPWLEAEIARVKPRVILALGVTAGTALYGRLVAIQKERGRLYHDSRFAPILCISWHPAAILRASSEEERTQRMQELIEDVRLAARSAQVTSEMTAFR